ncbi:MAG: carboxypeptidase regulatory-like domain-containing protein [Lewinella sp.]
MRSTIITRSCCPLPNNGPGNGQRILLTFLLLCLTLYGTAAFGQMVTTAVPAHSIRGVVTDAASEMPLTGVNITIVGSTPLVGAITDADGTFRFPEVAAGRMDLQLTYLGYEGQLVPNVVVNAGKETVLELRMREATTDLEAVVVKAYRGRGHPTNEMALLSARSISTEEMNRLSASFNDPALITTNFAGVTNSGSGANDIVVRGNSPKYLQWRLEGAPITNPNHFADQNNANGSTSTLNANLLTTSDFYTGAFPAEYGNALSGVYDVRLRNGNNQQLEGILGIGLIGTDLTLEGPLRAGYDGSFLVNYRYSTSSLLNSAGLVDVTGEPKFQDGTFKLHLPTKKAGIFSIFGLAGHSTTTFENLSIDEWNAPGDASMRSDVWEDYDKTSFLVNTGVNHTIALGEGGFLRSSLSFSTDGINDDLWQKPDSLAERMPSFISKVRSRNYRVSTIFQRKINARNSLQIGLTYMLYTQSATQQQLMAEASEPLNLLDFDEGIGNLRSFVSWKYRMTDRLTVVAGLHNNNVLFNNKHTLEPRLATQWQLSNKGALNFGYGLHSSMERVHHYFANIKQDDGSITQPNLDLGLLKAHHFVLGYNHRFSTNWVAKIEAYYQHLYDLPVENRQGSYFSTINESTELDYYDLVNAGTGTNKGVELSLQRFFAKGHYFMANVSLYESTYKTLGGEERNTRFNGNYALNVIGGKEFAGLGKRKNKTIGGNARFLFSGGQKIIPLLRDAQNNLAVDPGAGQFWDYERAFNRSLQDVSQLTLSASYKIERKRTTHEFFLNLENILNQKGRLTEFYDTNEPENIGYTTQFGLLPNLMYRLYF